ncbi:unnamed protein product [Soboliphyme baturini]|uniref:ACB domain-containing protein n=1 Tax=Soboliphyme baturini TaxID=241478 RepID=A0A183IF50_9BILA|nr:unnamed protein product [Soboliphyme baturini]
MSKPSGSSLGAAYSRLPPNAADINGLTCRLEISKDLHGRHERYSWQLKEAAFMKWLGSKEPSARVRYVDTVKAAAVAKAKADPWEKFGEVLESNFSRQIKYSGRPSAVSEVKRLTVSES